MFEAKPFLKTLTSRPGVYRMFDSEDVVLYVGKAKDLKKRVSSYFRANQSPKTAVMVAKIDHIEVTVTHTESEAFLLESNLIKEYRPRYNVLFRDDKSYPYIFISDKDDYPRMCLHRGAHRKKGRYLGPYHNAGAVRETINLLQKTFRIRQCEDSYFANRSRPCLQYQIKRCTAPCTSYISEKAYQRDVNYALMFLQGKSQQVTDQLVQAMDASSRKKDFERAAVFRDQIRNLQKITEKQYISGERGDVDVVACVTHSGKACVQVFCIRQGRNLGNRSYFPRLPDTMNEQDILQAFLSQYYLQHEIPAEILLSHDIPERELTESIFSEKSQHKVKLKYRLRTDRKQWVDMALSNAEQALNSKLTSNAGMLERFEALQDVLQLPSLPQRLECFDISHTQGEAAVASCVVFTLDGANKNDYRRFNIKDIEPGDDYAAMRQALGRRYKRLKKGEGIIPDILFVDGGKGQLRQAIEILDELKIDPPMVVGVAKGEGRKSGLEKLVFSDGRPELLPGADSQALHLVLQIRDEAHRFAISGHRAQRAKARQKSPLENISGLGPKRRQQLIRHFGGIQGITQAGVGDMAKVQGISKNLAQMIYDVFHGEPS